MYVLCRPSPTYLLGPLAESSATPARVSRLLTAIYDTPGMCGRGHCIVKEATWWLINIPRGQHIGDFVVARSFRHVCRAIAASLLELCQLASSYNSRGKKATSLGLRNDERCEGCSVAFLARLNAYFWKVHFPFSSSLFSGWFNYFAARLFPNRCNVELDIHWTKASVKNTSRCSCVFL